MTASQINDRANAIRQALTEPAEPDAAWEALKEIAALDPRSKEWHMTNPPTHAACYRAVEIAKRALAQQGVDDQIDRAVFDSQRRINKLSCPKPDSGEGE